MADLRVLFPSRIIERHVGGNSTYARKIASGLSAHGIETGLIPSASSAPLTAAFESIAALRRQPGTVLHYSADTGALFRGRARSVVTIHGVASRWITVARSASQERIWRYRVSRAASTADQIITVSESSADDVSTIFDVPRGSIEVIPHGIDHAHFRVEQVLSADVSGRVPRYFALFLGNLEPRKNVVNLINAFESPEIRALGLPLVIAGRPAWNYEATLDAIRAAENVIYLGFVSDEDRVALMQSTSLFVFPSLYEGFGFPVLEAMTAGAPVLTSRAGSLAEVAGPARTIVDTSAEGIAASVIEAIGDDDWRRRVVPEGRAWADQYQWERSVSAHVGVYERVVG